MMFSCISRLAGIAAVAFVLPMTPVGAQEHPEHPKQEAKADAKTGVTMPELATVIKDHIKSKSENGKFPVSDETTSETVALELDHVHDERLSRIDKNTYFACVDMKSPSGQTYDIDFILKGSSKDTLKVTETAVHKIDGKARYTWKEEDGLWTKQKLAESAQ